MVFSSALFTAASASGWLDRKPAVPDATVAQALDRPLAVQPGWAAAGFSLMYRRPTIRIAAAVTVPTIAHTLESVPYQLLSLSLMSAFRCDSSGGLSPPKSCSATE